jgi:hypothetical protein
MPIIKKRVIRKGGSLKKGGCSQNAAINDSYNLLDDAIKKTTGGKKGGSYANVNDNYMLNQKTTGGKKGGCYANVNDNYMLIDQKTTGGKKGGCYANVNDNYMLTDQKTTGGKKGGSYANVNDSYMLTQKKTGGKKKGGNLFSMGKTLFNSVLTENNGQAIPPPVQSVVDTPPPPVSAPPAPPVPPPVSAQPQTAVATTPAVTKGGRGRRNAGCGCQGTKKGGFDLAPFAAAVTLLATRLMTEKKDFEMFDGPVNSRKGSRTTRTMKKY